MLSLVCVPSRRYSPTEAALMWELGLLPPSYAQEGMQRLSSLHNTVHESPQRGEIPEEKLMSTSNYWKWVVRRSTEGEAKCKEAPLINHTLGRLSAGPEWTCATAPTPAWESFPKTFSQLLIKCRVLCRGADSLVVPWYLWLVTHKGSSDEQQLEQPKVCLSREQTKQRMICCRALRISQDSVLKGDRKDPNITVSMKGFWLGITEQSPPEKNIKMLSFGCPSKREGRASLTSRSGLCFWYHLPLLPLSLQRKDFDLDSPQKIYVSQI